VARKTFLVNGQMRFSRAVCTLFHRSMRVLTADQRAELEAKVKRCGEHLLQAAVRTADGALTWPSTSYVTGFSHGAAGITYALNEIGSELGAGDLKQAARDGHLSERWAPQDTLSLRTCDKMRLSRPNRVTSILLLHRQHNWLHRARVETRDHLSFDQCSWCHLGSNSSLPPPPSLRPIEGASQALPHLKQQQRRPSEAAAMVLLLLLWNG
jgi:hypothetical protein